MRVLFITANRIGDAVLTTGIYQHLVTSVTDARMTVVCGPLAAPLFAVAPGLERLIVLPKRRLAGHWFRLWFQVVATRWDLVVDLRDSIVGRTVFARHRVVHTRRRAGIAEAAVHKVEALGWVVGVSPPPVPTLWLDDHSKAAAAALIGTAVHASERQPSLALAPIANWRGKEWPSERFVALARELLGPSGPLSGGVVMVLAAPGERERAAPLVKALVADVGAERVIDLIGRTDALTAAACLAEADLFIGNDSGLMHIAAAVGTPTIGLFGPGLPEIYGPWGQWTAVVTSVVPGEVLRARVARGDAPNGLMDGINVSMVKGAAVDLLNRRSALEFTMGA